MINILASKLCDSEVGFRLFGVLGNVIQFIQIAVPIILIIVGTIDLVKAMIAQSDDQMKKAQSTLIKRVITGVIIFFVPILVNFVIGLVNTNTDDENWCVMWSFAHPNDAMKKADEIRDAVNKYVDIENNISPDDCEKQGGTYVGEKDAKLYNNQICVKSNIINLNDQIKER